MLQQTQVATVIEYFNKWIKKWPTISDLSKATLEEVNEMWSGLGYYSRGRRLHEGAQKLTKIRGKKSGHMPTTAKGLMKELPGVGRYTAGAVASIAYNEVTGVVDGNVIRVMSRLRMIGAYMSSQAVSELFWELANTVVDPDFPGDFNQSMMELGATICTPKAPQCSLCPVKKICKAYQRYSTYESKIQSTIIDAFMKNNGDDDVDHVDENDGGNASTAANEVDLIVDISAGDKDAVGGDKVNREKYVSGEKVVNIGDKCVVSGNEDIVSGDKTVGEKDDVGEDKVFMDDFNLADIEDFADCKFCLTSEEPWYPHLGVTNYPRKTKKKPPSAEKFISVIIEHNDKFLFSQRPDKGLLANMWEFPLTEIEKENKEVIEINVIRKELKRRFLFINVDKLKLCGEVSHVFSHRFHVYRVYHATLSNVPETVEDTDGRATMWMSRVEANKAAITTAIKKIMEVKDKCKKGKRKRTNKEQQTLDKIFTKKTKN